MNQSPTGSVAYASGDSAQAMRLLLTMLGSAPIGMCIIDTHLRYQLVNDELARLNGVPAKDHIGRHVGDIVPSLEEAARAVLEEVCATRQPLLGREFVGETAMQPGKQRVWLESWFPLLRPDGTVWACGVTCEEVTEKKEMERRLKEAALARDRFIAFLSHELRNLAAPASTAFHVLKTHPSDPAVVARMERIVEANHDAMKRLLDDLLDTARFENGLSLDLAPCNLYRLAAEAIEATWPVAMDAEVQLVLHPVGRQIEVQGDPRRLKQVCSNLLINAVRHSPPRGLVEVTVDASELEATIAVSDHGEGMEPAVLAKVFEPFFATKQSAHRGGLGIGLTLAKQIVERHGGAIEAKSEGPGTGSTFIVRLPVSLQFSQGAQ